jgi:hypothetical protein
VGFEKKKKIEIVDLMAGKKKKKKKSQQLQPFSKQYLHHPSINDGKKICNTRFC